MRVFASWCVCCGALTVQCFGPQHEPQAAATRASSPLEHVFSQTHTRTLSNSSRTDPDSNMYASSSFPQCMSPLLCPCPHAHCVCLRHLPLCPCPHVPRLQGALPLTELVYAAFRKLFQCCSRKSEEELLPVYHTINDAKTRPHEVCCCCFCWCRDSCCWLYTVCP